jgi:hypothetical protein
MFLHKPELDMASLTTRLALTVAGILLCAAAQTDEPTQAPHKSVPVDGRADEASVAKPIEPKFEMKVSEPQFQKPDPVDLPDFTYWEVKVQYNVASNSAWSPGKEKLDSFVYIQRRSGRLPREQRRLVIGYCRVWLAVQDRGQRGETAPP